MSQNPFDGTRPPAEGQDESTRAIRALSPEDLAGTQAGQESQVGQEAQVSQPVQQGGWGAPPAPGQSQQPAQGGWGSSPQQSRQDVQQGGWGAPPAPGQDQQPAQGGWASSQQSQQNVQQSGWGAPPQQNVQQSGWNAPAAGTAEEHSKAFLGNLLTALFGWLGGLIGWMMAKDSHPWAREQNAKAFNFTLGMDILLLVVYGIGVSMLLSDSAGIAMILFLVCTLIGTARLVLCLLQAMKAKKGEPVKYPFGLPVLK